MVPDFQGKKIEYQGTIYNTSAGGQTRTSSLYQASPGSGYSVTTSSSPPTINTNTDPLQVNFSFGEGRGHSHSFKVPFAFLAPGHIRC